MSKAAELIAGLQSQAEFESEGGFSLDREKARQKMRQFQLADPHRYVLLLVECVALRGASVIEFEIDADDMRMRSDAVLEWEDLDELYTSLFVDRSGDGIRSRRELALACNAVMALNPKFVEVTSFGPKGGVRALLRPNQPDDIAVVEAAQPNGTLIHVKERFRPGLMVRFVLDTQGTLPEELLLRERCGRSSIPITLDGVRISHGLPKHLLAAVPFEAEDLRGVGGIDIERLDRSGIVLLSNGVEIATHELRDSVPGLWFWVDARALRKDVSQNDVARGDPGYTAMLATIASVRDRVLGQLAESWRTGKFDAHSQPSADEVFKLLSSCFMRWATHEWLRPDAGPLGRLADLPLWRTTDSRWLDSRAVASQADPERGVLFSRRDYDGVIPEGWTTILFPWSGDEETAAIARVFVGANDVTSDLARKVPAELARRQWKARPHEPRLPQGHWPVRLPFAVGEHRGEVSLRPGRYTNVRVIVDGCMLHEVEFEGPLIGIAAVLEGPYAPLADYSRAQLDATWASGLLVVLAQIPALLEGWASAHGVDASSYVRTTMIALSDPTLPERWLEAFGFKAGAAMVARLGAPVLLPRLGLDQPEPGIISQLVTFETLDRRRVSLVELHRERNVREYQRGRLLVVIPDAPYMPDVQVLVVRANAEERRLLVAVFGQACLHDDTATLQRQLARQEFQARPKITPSRPSSRDCTRSIEITDGDIRGYVGIDAREHHRSQTQWSAKVELIADSRRIGELTLPCPLSGVTASVEWSSAPINDQYSGLSGSPKPLVEALHRGLLAILREQVERCATLGVPPTGDLRRLLFAAALVPFPSVRHFETWQWHRRQHAEFEQAIAAYWPIFEFTPQYDLDAVVQAIDLLETEGRPRTHEVIVDLLGPAKRAASLGEHGQFQRQLLELFASFERLAMFETASGRVASLADVSAVFASSWTVSWLQDPSLRTSDADHELMLRLDGDDRSFLAQLYGKDSLSEASARVRELQEREQFGTRQVLDRIELEGINRMIAVEFEVDGFEGQLAIPPWAPADMAVMSLTICHQRRRIETVPIHAVVPVLGIVDDAEVEFEQPFVKVAQASSRMAALRKQINEVLQTQLFPRLAESYSELAAGGRTVAWAWITYYWLRTAEGAGDDPKRLSEIGRRFAELPGFIDVDGQQRTLDDLIRRYQACGTLYTLEQPSTRSLATNEPVLLLRPEDRNVIARLFAKQTDYEPLLRELAEGQERHGRAAHAPAVSTLPEPASVLQRVDLDQHGLTGALWLPAQFPFARDVALVCRERVVERIGTNNRWLLDELPIQGLVLGELGSDRRFTKAELDAHQRGYLVGRVINAYSQLLEQYRHELEHPDRVDMHDVEQARRRAVRIDILRTAAIALSQSDRGVPEDELTANLRQRLADVPLLRLNTGRLISIQLGREVRPIELDHLELWEPRDPASEKFESELLGALSEAGEQVAATAETKQADEQAGLALLAALLGQATTPATKPAAKPEPSEDEEPEPELETAVPVVPVVPATPVVPFMPPDPVGDLLEAIRDELRLVREGQASLLAEGLLDKIRADPGRGRGPLIAIDGAVVFDSKHPCFEQALEQPDDPIWVSFLASVAYTALNHWQEQVTDADELAFHARHAALLVSGVLSPASA